MASSGDRRDAPEPEALDGVFHALANAHRREIVRFLGQQPAAIHHLAQLRGLSLPAKAPPATTAAIACAFKTATSSSLSARIP